MRGAYYNEIDPAAAEWLRELMKAGLIAEGDVDERSIADVKPDDVRGYTQCHWFAGIAGWSLALRLAGWPDDRPVWTGSCPCQPFSCAGRGRGTEDARHLWPQFRQLIAECRPARCFGEQVASKAGRAWLSGVRADLEDLGYRVGAGDLCSAGAGAPNIRQRLYWVANAEAAKRWWSTGSDDGRRGLAETGGPSPASGLAITEHAERGPVDGPGEDGRDGQDCGRQEAHGEPGACGEVRGLVDSTGRGLGTDGRAPGRTGHAYQRDAAGRMGDADGRDAGGREQRLQPVGGECLDTAAAREGFDGRRQTADGRRIVRLVYAEQSGLEGLSGHEHDGRESRWIIEDAVGSTPAAGPACFWGVSELIPCTDGTARRVEPGVFPLATGVSGRVGLLRGYGNAINPEVAARFIQAAEEAIGDQ